jgi:membrane-bound inhibitor of C-type lysozyme
MVLAAPFLLCGCGPSARDQSAAQGPAPAPPVKATDIPVDNAIALPPTANGGSAILTRDASKVEGTVHYNCAGGVTLTVDHDLAWDVLRLTIDAKTFQLTNMLSDTATTRYRSETGRTPGHSLMWQTRGDEATLIEGPVKAPADSARQKAMSCRRTG